MKIINLFIRKYGPRLCLGAFLLVLAACSTESPVYQADELGLEMDPSPLKWSKEANRERAASLEGQRLEQTVYIFAEVSGGIEQVAFYVDDTKRSGKPVQVEYAAPYDLAGTDRNKIARPFNTKKLKDGEHTLTANVIFHDGKSKVVTAAFVVANGPRAVAPPSAPAKGYRADYYVAPNGSDGNDGSLNAPFATLRKAGSLVKAGQTIALRGGVYKEYNDVAGGFSAPTTSFTKSGTAARPIIIESYPGERAVIDGSGIVRSKSWSQAQQSQAQRPALLAVKGDYYIVRNIEFKNSAGAGLQFYPGTEHNTAEGVDSHHHHGHGLMAEESDYARVEGGRFHHNYSSSNGGDSADGVNLAYARHGVVRRVESYNNSDDGVDFVRAYDMLAENNRVWKNGYRPDGSVAPLGNGNGVKAGGDGGGAYSISNHRNVIRKNLVYLNKNTALDANAGGGIAFYNNTTWRNGSAGDGRYFDNVVFKNNLSFGEPKPLISNTKPSGSKGKWPVNLYNNWSDNPGSKGTNLPVDPKFISTDPQSADFLRLSSSSPVVDEGIDVGLPYAGSAPDLGVFERDLTSVASN